MPRLPLLLPGVWRLPHQLVLQCHGFPFSMYGGTALILVQNIAIASLVLKYSGNSVGIAGWLGGLIAAGMALFNKGWIDNERLSLLQATAGVLNVASKVPQILTIWSEGGTGQLSALAVSHAPFPLVIHGVCLLTLTPCLTVCQLPPRLPLPHLHYASRSRRYTPLRLHRGLRAQCRALLAGYILLERANMKGHRVEEA